MILYKYYLLILKIQDHVKVFNSKFLNIFLKILNKLLYLKMTYFLIINLYLLYLNPISLININQIIITKMLFQLIY